MTHTPVDTTRIAAAVTEILAAIGEHPNRPGLLGTPERVAEHLGALFAGVGTDPARHLHAFDEFADVPGEAILLRSLEFTSVCEHHLLPFRGTVDIAYLPAERVVGFGSFSKVIADFAARPQVQERLTDQIASAIEHALLPKGVLVCVSAVHGCMTDRGPQQHQSSIVTLASRGQLSQAAERAEILSLIRGTE